MPRFLKKPIYLACGHKDMRKNINGLVAIVEGNFQLDPFVSELFVFCNRSWDRLKSLEWDRDWFWPAKHRQFGASSEKSDYDYGQLCLFNEAKLFADRIPT